MVTCGCIEALAPGSPPGLGSFTRGGHNRRIDVRLGSSVRGIASFGTVVGTSEPVAHKPLGIGSSLFSSKGVSDTTGIAACTDSHRQYVRGFVHKSPRRHSFQGFVQIDNESTAMGGVSLSLHQSNTHPRSPESRGGHTFEKEDPSRGVEVAPRVGSDDLEPLRESGGGSIRHERECALPVVLLPVSLPAGRGCAHIALASSQAVCVSSDQDIATGVIQDQGGASVSDTHSPELAEPALVPRPDGAGGTALAESGQEGHAIPGRRLGVAPEPGVMEPSYVAASGLSEDLSALQSRVLDTLMEARAPSTRRLYALKWGVFNRGSYRLGHLHRVRAPHSVSSSQEVSPLSLSVADVTQSLKRVNIRKAVGPDGIPGRVLKACTFQLAGVFKDIFNLSLSLSVVPACFKKSTIVPIPKKNKITCLNDWRPVALTPIFSKCFEKLVRDYICSVLPASLDPLQFAYRSNHSIDDAIAFTLHTALSHLENKYTYVRMLYMDYSSAFNTIVPATLVVKLQTLGLNRSQVVRMGNNTSSPLTLNTGAPQGCVLSPLLYSLYTHDCTATHSSNVIVKFADDTTGIGLITDNDETAYREEVSTLTKWCQENHLSLNIDKTKELVVDFRRQSREHTPISIDKTPVEWVSNFKFLCVHITEDLTWSAHTDAGLKKAHQRLFFLRWLRKFGMSPSFLRSFYTCTVESILTGCITAWFGNSTAGIRKALQRVVQTVRHIVGGELPSLQDIYTRRCMRKARRIIKDSSHPSHRLLSLLPSGRRLRSIRSCTSRLRDSFFPQAIRLMNRKN